MIVAVCSARGGIVRNFRVLLPAAAIFLCLFPVLCLCCLVGEGATGSREANSSRERAMRDIITSTIVGRKRINVRLEILGSAISFRALIMDRSTRQSYSINFQ